MPVMSVTVMGLSIVWEQLWDVIPTSPYFSTLENSMSTLVIILVGAGCGGSSPHCKAVKGCGFRWGLGCRWLVGLRV